MGPGSMQTWLVPPLPTRPDLELQGLADGRLGIRIFISRSQRTVDCLLFFCLFIPPTRANHAQIGAEYFDRHRRCLLGLDVGFFLTFFFGFVIFPAGHRKRGSFLCLHASPGRRGIQEVGQGAEVHVIGHLLLLGGRQAVCGARDS
jgi:hypothetical protein